LVTAVAAGAGSDLGTAAFGESPGAAELTAGDEGNRT